MLLRALVVVAVVVSALAGGVGALAAVRSDHELSVGTVRTTVEPFRAGALDLYVPVVDWGVRFGGVRLPARVRVDVRSVDREAVVALARAGSLDVGGVRREATEALARHLRLATAAAFGGALALGLLVAFAVRGRTGPRLRFTLLAAGLTALGLGVAIAILLPPRGDLGEPRYYANGPDIPWALEAVRTLEESAVTLDREIDAQLVGLARLVVRPGRRAPLTGAPRLTIASDLHNNALVVPALERATRDRPLLLVGDLTDSGSPLEAGLVSRVTRAGRPVILVAGNHDSDALERRFARAGAVVLTRRGRLGTDGRPHGPVVVRIGDLRVAGYDDPLKRRRSEDYRSHGAVQSAEARRAFADWLRPLVGRVDVVLVHPPSLAADALAELRDEPPEHPLVLAVGHTHEAGIDHRAGDPVTVVNGGSVGGAGARHVGADTPIGLAALTYATQDGFRPLAADLVELDPGDGSAVARRFRLDENAGRSDG